MPASAAAAPPVAVVPAAAAAAVVPEVPVPVPQLADAPPELREMEADFLRSLHEVTIRAWGVGDSVLPPRPCEVERPTSCVRLHSQAPQ